MSATAISDEPALLAAIIAEPEEDTHRLAFADWLDENEQDDWAAFIRSQCWLARHDNNHCKTCPKFTHTGRLRCKVCRELRKHWNVESTLAYRVAIAWAKKLNGVVSSFGSSGFVFTRSYPDSGFIRFTTARGFIKEAFCANDYWELLTPDGVIFDKILPALTIAHPVQEVTLLGGYELLPRHRLIRDSYRARFPRTRFVLETPRD